MSVYIVGGMLKSNRKKEQVRYRGKNVGVYGGGMPKSKSKVKEKSSNIYRALIH